LPDSELELLSLQMATLNSRAGKILVPVYSPNHTFALSVGAIEYFPYYVNGSKCYVYPPSLDDAFFSSVSPFIAVLLLRKIRIVRHAVPVHRGVMDIEALNEKCVS
jgi:hypothetical protein